jgi:hypothetical protein
MVDTHWAIAAFACNWQVVLLSNKIESADERLQRGNGAQA